MRHVQVALLLAAGCAGGELTDVASVEVAVLGGLSQENDYCDGAQWTLIRRAWNVGRVVAQTPEFAQCVRNRNYIPCDDDPFENTAAGRAEGEEIGILASRTPTIVRVECRVLDDAFGRTSWSDVEHPLHGGDEVITLAKQLLDPYKALPFDRDSNSVAGVLWHEVLHTHDFHHGTGETSEFAEECGFEPDDGWSWYSNSMNEIVEACIENGYLYLVMNAYWRLLGRYPTYDERLERYAAVGNGLLTSPQALDDAIALLPADLAMSAMRF